ncbi:Crp/Fnr family transcriptional regulator [Candidatus Roizmanbacteria bacterium]|nr:Crp/Fnr family transcriptional regulator [Candidatus Roizmanbacteria bacterium]
MDAAIQQTVSRFFAQFPAQTLPHKEPLIHPDKTLTAVFYLKKGHVRNYMVTTHGVELTVHIFTAGAFFPMTEALAGIPNRYYYETVGEVKLNICPKARVIKFLLENPPVLMDLSKRLLGGLDRLALRLERTSTMNAKERLISTLVFLARHFGKSTPQGDLITHKFTHSDLAALTGLTRETTSRQWKQLERKKLTAYYSRHILLPDVALLERENGL